MKAKSQKLELREGSIEGLNTAIEATNLAENASSITPAKAVFGSVNTLLVLIGGSPTVDEPDYVGIGLLCADICRVLDRGTNGKEPGELSQSVYGAIDQLLVTVPNIERKLAKWSKRNVVYRSFYVMKNKKAVAAWRLSLENILQVFNEALLVETDPAAPAVRHDATDSHIVVSGTENDIMNIPAVVSDSNGSASKRPEDTHGQSRMPAYASAPGESLAPLPGSTRRTISDIRRDIHTMVSQLEPNNRDTRTVVSEIRRVIAKDQESNDSRDLLTQTSMLGESPPPPPRIFFGRDELIEKVVDLARKLTPIALIGVGGTGKTSIALTVLHHNRIKQKFGHDRRFIRCDRFPASSANLLRQLSKVIGAGVQNPENLTSLREFLSSKEMLIVLDNAESILDPRGADAQEIYVMVEELSLFNNICICITSRISTTPPAFKWLEVPTLSTDAARHAFYRIHGSGIDRLGKQNQWDTSQSNQELERQQAGLLLTQHNRSIATTIELLLASPLFRKLGPDARALLEVVAFFPQGIDEDNLIWLFPIIPDRTNIFNGFRTLSLTYRSNGFIKMLAPLQDYLSPRDPGMSPLLLATKERYFTRMPINFAPNMPNFKETQWIISEDINVEHLLDVFTTIDANSDSIWATCINFMEHLYWHKRRPTILKPKIEGLPDDHRSKPECLFWLALLFGSVGDDVEYEQLLTHAINLWREQGDGNQVTVKLMKLSDTNRFLGFHEEGMKQAKEELEIREWFGDAIGQAHCSIMPGFLLRSDIQLNTVEETALRTLNLLPEEGKQLMVCESYRTLGNVYRSKGHTRQAIYHVEAAIKIASAFNWRETLFCLHYELAELLHSECRFDEAHVHIRHAKSYTADSAHHLGRATELQAWIWYNQRELEKARSEALHAVEVYGSVGAAKGVEECRQLLRNIEKELNPPFVSAQGIGR